MDSNLDRYCPMQVGGPTCLLLSYLWTEFLHLLSFIVTPKPVLPALSQSFAGRAAKNLSLPMCSFLAEIKKADSQHSCLSSRTVNGYPFCVCWVPCFSQFCAFCSWFYCLKCPSPTPKHSPLCFLLVPVSERCPLNVPKHQKVGMCLMEKIYVS